MGIEYGKPVVFEAWEDETRMNAEACGEGASRLNVERRRRDKFVCGEFREMRCTTGEG